MLAHPSVIMHIKLDTARLEDEHAEFGALPSNGPRSELAAVSSAAPARHPHTGGREPQR